MTPITAERLIAAAGRWPTRSGASGPSANTGTVIFSVWDGDWAILEEWSELGSRDMDCIGRMVMRPRERERASQYGPNNSRIEGYVQGLHGLVKTLTDNVYYYQDELGSTSHIANATGALLESYRYDLYGKPTYWSPTNSQLPSSNYNTRDLFTGQRFVAEIGLYDDRNRFMSPDLGRFLQPDPIGFKADRSNLYRYCGNDWANRSDPMGLDATEEEKAARGPDKDQQQPDPTVPLKDNSRGYLGDGHSRRDWSGPVHEASRDNNNVPVMERATVSTVQQPTYPRSPSVNSNTRLAVGNSIDARWLTHFGPTAREGASQQRFAKAMAYGVGYPAAAAMTVPVLPLYGAAVLGAGRVIAPIAGKAIPIAWALAKGLEQTSESPGTSLPEDPIPYQMEQPARPSGSEFTKTNPDFLGPPPD